MESRFFPRLDTRGKVTQAAGPLAWENTASMPYSLARDSRLFIKPKFHPCVFAMRKVLWNVLFIFWSIEDFPIVLCVFQLVAVFDEVQAGRTASPSEKVSNGYSSSASPEPLCYFPHLDYKEPIRGEIEVNEAVLKASTWASEIFHEFPKNRMDNTRRLFHEFCRKMWRCEKVCGL